MTTKWTWYSCYPVWRLAANCEQSCLLFSYVWEAKTNVITSPCGWFHSIWKFLPDTGIARAAPDIYIPNWRSDKHSACNSGPANLRNLATSLERPLFDSSCGYVRPFRKHWLDALFVSKHTLTFRVDVVWQRVRWETGGTEDRELQQEYDLRGLGGERPAAGWRWGETQQRDE